MLGNYLQPLHNKLDIQNYSCHIDCLGLNIGLIHIENLHNLGASIEN